MQLYASKLQAQNFTLCSSIKTPHFFSSNFIFLGPPWFWGESREGGGGKSVRRSSDGEWEQLSFG